MLISIVAPCYNDAGNVAELVRRLNAVSMKMQIPFEIIIVDDRSPDDAWPVVQRLAEQYINVRGYRLSKNCGQHIAITAGIEQTRGDFVVIMDGDLQDLPEEIPTLYSKLQEGYDLVFTVRKERQDSFMRKIVSIAYRYVINKLSGLTMPYNISMMRMFTREFADHYLLINEKHRSLGALFSWMGFKQTQVIVEHGQRFSGRTNFSSWRLLVRAFNNISSFSTIPIALIGFLGMVISGISFLFGLLILLRFLFGTASGQPGWPSLICAISFSTGMIMLSLAVIGKYIANIYSEVLDRPLYMIAESTASENTDGTENE